MTANNQIRIAMPVAILVALAIQFIAPSAFAATVYWDSNGTVAGAGATPTGTWGTSTFWNATSTGLTTTPAAWLSGDTANPVRLVHCYRILLLKVVAFGLKSRRV